MRCVVTLAAKPIPQQGLARHRDLTQYLHTDLQDSTQLKSPCTRLIAGHIEAAHQLVEEMYTSAASTLE
jgi:hypothetical protein